jgi:hypothetical protein
LAALVLSIISWLEICSIECTEVHFYRYFGMKFEYMGLLFFVPLLTIHVLHAGIHGSLRMQGSCWPEPSARNFISSWFKST